MKKETLQTILLAACVLILAASNLSRPVEKASAAPADNSANAVCSSTRSVQVSGTAVVNVTPDRALIQVGVESNGTSPQIVEANNSKTIKQVLQALYRLGIEEKDVVTDWYVINPIYTNYDNLKIKGYRINNLVAVTVRDISLVNQVITASLAAGANEVVNVEFYLSDLRQYRDQARELAMVAAKEKAEDLAQAAGAETGCVLSIHENSWSHYNGWWYGRGGSTSNLWAQNTIQNVEPAAGAGGITDDGPVSLGQVSVRAEVSASFSLK